MTFTVSWRVYAEQKLAQMWLASRDREAITEATIATENNLG